MQVVFGLPISNDSKYALKNVSTFHRSTCLKKHRKGFSLKQQRRRSICTPDSNSHWRISQYNYKPPIVGSDPPAKTSQRNAFINRQLNVWGRSRTKQQCRQTSKRNPNQKSTLLLWVAAYSWDSCIVSSPWRNSDTFHSPISHAHRAQLHRDHCHNLPHWHHHRHG